MKITNEQLRQIIKEEIEYALSEAQSPYSGVSNESKYEFMQDELVYGLRERGYNANPSEHRSQLIIVKGRNGKRIYLNLINLSKKDPNNIMGALQAALKQITDEDTDMSMRRKASRERMAQGGESVTIDDPTMEQ